ncbi:ABC transporter ATP-binding protein [Pseudomonas chlororaphis]|uniref:ABC transporter ATP-binding protein n=1 Tax=Pseudomonas chlororaphis TaxID=587753 RepID=A0A1Q8EPU4_9PSED|nr:ABC transporter ATP-binding protein [Pseudomonas chlororaphis]OLF53823.1 ABC transporter ATP-binding protein [Pseudomonas chlororaphis]
MIDLSHLTKTFAGKTAVDRLSFRASAGEVLGVLGPNGAGKSTSMRMLGGTLLPTSGTVCVHGLDIRRQRRQAQRLIGYVPEGLSADSEMSVRGFLGYIAQVRGYRGALKRQRIGAMLDLFDLETVGQQRIATLSKGYRRRVDLAQALLHDPKVLLLDEPTDGLDPAQRHHVRELIKYWAQNKTVLISTHLLEEVSAVCNRVVVINDGQLLADSTPRELESRSRYHQAVTLTSARPLDILELAVLPGVAGIEQGCEPHSITVLAKPGATILAGIDQLIARSGWPVSQRVVERGRLEEVFRRLIQEQQA